MKTNVIVLLIGLILVFVLGKFYFDHTDNQKKLIKAEQEKADIEKERKEIIEGELAELKATLEEAKQNLKNLNSEIRTLSAEITTLKKDNSKLASRKAYLSAQIKKEQSRLSDTKTSILSILNNQLSSLLDKRLRKISIFNDDSSFAFYVGRRNYVSLESNNMIKIERFVHYSSTGEYLKPIYQDKDNGNNRFLITTYLADLNDLNLDQVQIEDLSTKEKLPFQKDFKEETYVSLVIPLNDERTATLINSIEYNGKSYDRTSSKQSVEFYTTSVGEAKDVSNLLKILKSLS